MQLRIRKFSPIDREWPIFEVMDGDCVLFDVTKSDTGDLELAFHDGAKDKVVPLDEVMRVIQEATELLDNQG